MNEKPSPLLAGHREADAADRGYFAAGAGGRGFESPSGEIPIAQLVERLTYRYRPLLRLTVPGVSIGER